MEEACGGDEVNGGVALDRPGFHLTVMVQVLLGDCQEWPGLQKWTLAEGSPFFRHA